MRYFYEKPERYRSTYGNTYGCDHPVYDVCTLFKIGKKGLAVIQQRYYQETKHIYWIEIDSWLIDTIYSYPKFKTFFDERAMEPEHNLYPTISIRQLMWALKDEAYSTREMGNLL